MLLEKAVALAASTVMALSGNTVEKVAFRSTPVMVSCTPGGSPAPYAGERYNRLRAPSSFGHPAVEPLNTANTNIVNYRQIFEISLAPLAHTEYVSRSLLCMCMYAMQEMFLHLLPVLSQTWARYRKVRRGCHLPSLLPPAAFRPSCP